MMNKNQKLLVGAAALAGTFGVLVLTNAFDLKRNIPREYYKYKYMFSEKLKHECDVLFVGDSITWLYKLDKHFSGKNYINRGISGDRTYQILSRCEHTFKNIKPEKVVILGGINDLAEGRTVYEVLVNIFKTVELSKKYNPSAKIFVESVYPVNNNGNNKRHDTCTDKIIELNGALKENAGKLGYTYIDMFAVLRTENDGFIESYTYDGLHPCEEGYEVITKELKKYIYKDNQHIGQA